MTSHRHRHGFLPAVQSMLDILVVALFLMTFLAQPSRIPSESMEPTLLVGDFLLVDKQIFSPPSLFNPLPGRDLRRNDIIVFHYPLDPSVLLVKRVVGLPGDRLHLSGNHLFLNGVRQDEPFAIYRDSMPDDFRDNFPNLRYANPAVNTLWWAQLRRILDSNNQHSNNQNSNSQNSIDRDSRKSDSSEITVPPGQYFVLGDNRNDSEDSRYWGFVPRSSVIGQPLVVYFSLSQSNKVVMPILPARPATQTRHLANALSRIARWDRIGKILR